MSIHNRLNPRPKPWANSGQCGRLRSSNGQSPQPAGFDVRRHGCRRNKHQLDLTPDQSIDRGSGAFIRDTHYIHARHRFE